MRVRSERGTKQQSIVFLAAPVLPEADARGGRQRRRDRRCCAANMGRCQYADLTIAVMDKVSEHHVLIVIIGENVCIMGLPVENKRHIFISLG